MTPEERAELDRLLDLAEKEQLLAAAPAPAEHDAQQSLSERLETVAVLEQEHDHVKRVRQALAPAAEWIEE